MTSETTLIELPPTATYAVRSAEWIPVSETESLLVIRLRKTAHGREEADVYGVEEQISGHPAVREFLLVNTTDPDQHDAYRVTLGGPLHGCTCKAGSVHRYECKHVAALSKLSQE